MGKFIKKLTGNVSSEPMINHDGCWVGYVEDSGQLIYSDDTYVNTNGHEYVDLGLPSGTLWATCNVGAINPEDFGNYYAWGETTTKDSYTWSNYTWGTENNITKYNNSDGLDKLELSDDAANVVWGGDWHIPTYNQLNELFNYTNHPYVPEDENGVWGMRFTSGLDSTKSIFIPCANYYDSRYHSEALNINIWSSIISSEYDKKAEYVTVHDEGINFFDRDRCIGLSVRGVIDKYRRFKSKQNIPWILT